MSYGVPCPAHGSHAWLAISSQCLICNELSASVRDRLITMKFGSSYRVAAGVLLGASLLGLGLHTGASRRASLRIHVAPGVADARSQHGSLQAGVAELPWLLRAPEPHTAVTGALLPEVPRARGPLFALAYQYDTRVFDAARASAHNLGLVRRGTVLTALTKVKGRGCRQGAWYRLEGIGFACSRDGFLVSRSRPNFFLRQPAPELNAPLPFKYARIVTEGALRFHRMPSPEEESAIAALEAASEELPDVVETRMVGDYFVALDRLESAGDRAYYRTVRGRYVRAADVAPREPPRMQGVVLSGQRKLPYAFVHTESIVFKLAGSAPEAAGRAELHSRFPLLDRSLSGHPELVLGPDGLLLLRESVRVARRIPRPAEIGSGDKWIHVDLDEQTLVAYQGDEPVFVTLVSTGKEESGHATPVGLFRIREKHVSVTMSGDDPVDGHYEVAEVPWTQFYHESYALHGAYWHDTFGNTRSHGCTNIAPPDARWLFLWTTPQLPSGFQALRRAHGTYVYLTRDEAIQLADSAS
jgi:hypothetical protein